MRKREPLGVARAALHDISTNRTIRTLTHAREVARKAIAEVSREVVALVYVARVSTPNYDFHAFADTESDAIEALRCAWNVHQTITLARDSWADIAVDVQTVAVRSGDVLRDWQPFAKEV